MAKSKLPRTLAIVGLTVGFLLMAMWWYIATFNPFHLPTWEQVQSMTTSYSPPPLYSFLQHLIFVLLPALWLSVFTMHTPEIVNLSVWVFAVLLDGAILYSVGLLVDAIRDRARHQDENKVL